MTDAYPNANHFVGSSSLEDDQAAIAEALVAGMVRIEARQAQSAQFIVEHGADVVDGHSQVGIPLPRFVD
jgi:hypothetical protein